MHMLKVQIHLYTWQKMEVLSNICY